VIRFESVGHPLKFDSSVEVFCSYSHKDELLRNDFEACVAVLVQQGFARIWYDRQILAGDNWTAEIEEHLNSADIITFLVSADFLASEYCYKKEVRRALERGARGEVLVLPIIVRPCDWTDAPFAHLQGIPTGAKAVTAWTNRDEAWTDVAKSLKIAVRQALIRRQDEQKRQREVLSVALSRMQEKWSETRDETMKKILSAPPRRDEQWDRLFDTLGAKISDLDADLASSPQEKRPATGRQIPSLPPSLARLTRACLPTKKR
jgi:hypothetical protein